MKELNKAQGMSQLNQPHAMNQPQPQVMSQPQIVNQSQMMNQSKGMSQPQQMMNPSKGMNQPQQMMNQSQGMGQLQMMSRSQQVMNQPQMLNLNYGMWPPPQSAMDSLKFPNPMNPNFAASNPSKPGRGNWKGKKVLNKQKDNRRIEKPPANPGMGAIGGTGGGGGYRLPTLNELQSQNRMKARKFYPKKKFNNRVAPFAPRNTTSYIIRAKKSGGIASLVSPCPVTPAVLPTPIFSPSREVLVDMAKEEWGVDGYGSMKGLIRLRSSPGHEMEGPEDEEEEDGGGSSESDVEEHLEVERRLDHDLSRFEMIYPNCGNEHNNLLENRVDDQDTHIAQLEEENLTLKERLFLLESELSDLRRRLQCLERQQNHTLEDINEEVVENCSENESEGRGDFHTVIDNNEQVMEFMPENEGPQPVDPNENNAELSKTEKTSNELMEDPSNAPEDEKMEEDRKEGSGHPDEHH